MNTLSQIEIDKAIEAIWSASETNSAFKTLELAFQQEILSPESARLATAALMRLAMYDVYEERLQESVNKVVQNAIQSKNQSVVEAIVETLVALPTPNGLIDYAILTPVLSGLINQDELNPVLFEVIEKGITSASPKTEECIIRAVYAVTEKSERVTSSTVQIVGEMLENGSDFVFHEAISILYNLVKEKKDRNSNPDKYPFVWKRVKNHILTWDNLLAVEIITNAANILAQLMYQRGYIIDELPSPLDSLEKEKHNRFVYLIEHEYSRILYANPDKLDLFQLTEGQPVTIDSFVMNKFRYLRK